MTCVVGLVKDNIIYMGADSCSSNGDTYETTTEEKVFVRGEFIYGVSGSWRVNQLLKYKFTPPNNNNIDNVKGYLVVDYVDALKECFKNLTKHDEDEWDILVGYCGRLFVISSDFHVSERSEFKFNCIGSGSEMADGAMYVANTLPPEQRISSALRAAAAFSIGVVGPFIIKKLNAKIGQNMGVDNPDTTS